MRGGAQWRAHSGRRPSLAGGCSLPPRSWTGSLDNQALTIICELAHLYYRLVHTGGGAGNVNCLEQFVADFHGVTILPGFIRAYWPPAS